MKIENIVNKIQNDLSKKGNETYVVTHKVYNKSYKKVRKALIDNDTDALSKMQIFWTNIITNDPINPGMKISSQGPIITGDKLGSVCDVNEYIEAIEELLDEKAAKRKENRIMFDSSNMFIQNLGKSADDKTFTLATSLAVPAVIGKYTKADKDFFKWWAKDKNNAIFFRNYDGQLLRVPYSEGAVKKIMLDNEFWTNFFKTHGNDIKQWDSIINNIGWDYFEGSIDDEKTMIEKIHDSIPKCAMEKLMMVANIEIVNEIDENSKKVNKEKHVKNISMEVRCGKDGHITASEKALKDAFCEAFAEFDISELELMKSFTNDYGIAMYRLPLDQFISNPDKSLPPTWKKFLENKFKIQRKSQFYRLASFVNSIVDASNSSRQTLCIVGEGNDGKSVMIETLRDGFNKLVGKNTFVGTCSQAGLRPDNTQNGLINCLDSHLITVPDVDDTTEIINGSVFKAITGEDTCTCNKKFANPIEKRFEGTKFIMSTNNKVYLKNTFATTRIIPMYFSPRDASEEDWNITELKKKLLEEFKGFIAWCMDFTKQINKCLKNENPNKTVIIDLEDPAKSEKTVFEELCSKSQKFYYMTADEYADEDKGYFDEIFEELFEEQEGGYISKREFNDILHKWSEEHAGRGYNFNDRSKDMRMFNKYITANHNAVCIQKKINSCNEKRINNIIRKKRDNVKVGEDRELLDDIMDKLSKE